MHSLVQYRLLQGFEDPAVSPELWNSLVHQGSTDEIFLTWHWQKAWWEVFGRGRLILIMAESAGKPFFIAPLFADQGMVFFTGSGGSDYLDFIGNPGDYKILKNILHIAKEQIPDFLGFLFYHIPENSKIPSMLAEITKKTDWDIYEEGELLSPRLELREFPEKALQFSQKKSLLRHVAWFKHNGELKIDHFSRKEDIAPLLESFFNQHVDRWYNSPYPSLFVQPVERSFYRKLTEVLSETGWLRFTRVNWNGNPVAFHFGFNYNGSFLWYKPSFDITKASHSPGEVLISNLLLKAMEDLADIFDFGLGDEAFKKRFSTSNVTVKNWGIYPKNK